MIQNNAEAFARRKIGIVLKRPRIHERSRIKLSKREDFTGDLERVRGIREDTAQPGTGHVFQSTVTDAYAGEQILRVALSPQYYVSDFKTAGHELLWMLPANDASNRIISPNDGSESTWNAFLQMNRLTGQAMSQVYENRNLHNITLITGMNFSPFSRYHQRQSMKTAHSHVFVVTDEFLNAQETFNTRRELRQIFMQSGNSTIARSKKEERIHFPSPLSSSFFDAATVYLLYKMKKSEFGGFGVPLPIHTMSEFPHEGLRFLSNGTVTLDSPEYHQLLKESFIAIDEFYRFFLMPIFTENYVDVITQGEQNITKIQYNDAETALARYQELVTQPPFETISDETRNQWKKLILFLVPLLTKSTSYDIFSFGPGISMTAIQARDNNNIEVILSYGPFSGGSIEPLGFSKVRISQDEQQQLHDQFLSFENQKAEEEVHKQVLNELQQNFTQLPT